MKRAGAVVAAILIAAVILVLLSIHGPTLTSTPADLSNDPANCGATGFQVPSGDICRAGIAIPR